MPVSARLRHQPSTSTPFDGSQHQAMNGTLATDSPYTSVGFQESRRRRQIKSSTRLSRGLSGRSNTSSPFQATDLNIARPTMHGSPARPRTGSYTSSEDANGASSLTKTGRPSKALKGKPVHKCPVCEKIYTRNEHLRRHQLSHTIESLQCNIPGCGKQFRRTDVLARHREEHEAGLVRVSPPRHSENDPAATRVRKRKSPSSSSPSVNIQHARHDTAAAAAYSNSPAAGILPTDAEANGHHAHSDPSYHHARATSQFWDATSSQSSPGVFGPASHDIFNIGPTYTPFESHMANNFALPPPHSADEWSRPVVSRSPRSATSSIPCAWPLAQDKHLRNSFSPTDSNQSGYTSFSNPGIEPTVTNMASNMTFFEEQDACEGAVILHDVTNMTQTHPGMEGQAKLEQLEAQYLDAFWTKFNTMFSVMHRHTFDAYGTSPLVRALMISIGAQFFDDEAAQTMARTLRDACSKLLQRRPSLNYPCSRLWDLQAIFLHEAFSVYCSRRPSSRFSQGFEDLLTGLLSDHDNLFYSNPLANLADPSTGTTPSLASLDSESPRIQWVHLESKRRLLLASYILEIQQNAFFGSHRPVSDKNLPLPCSSALWDAYALDDWQALVFKEPNDCHSLTDFLAVVDNDTHGTSAQQQHSDPFMFNIATAHNVHSAAPLPAFRATDPSLTTSSKTRQCHFSTQAAQLALSTPIHDLLAVAGDTFVLGQKLTTREQFDQAGVELRAWRASVGAEEAVGSAKGVLEIVLEEGGGGARGRVGLLAEDWVVSLAALVLWAVLVWPQQQQQPNQHEARDASRISLTGNTQESQHRARMAIQSSRMDSTGAKACMVYAHSRVQGRLGWLAQDAAGMLRKLIGTAS